MQVILIERHPSLGNVGDIVEVKNGYARNYLFPNKKAIVADAINKQTFAEQRSEIEKQFTAKAVSAEELKSQVDSKVVILIKQAGKDERLYGSVSSTDIVNAIKEELKIELPKSVVRLTSQIKYLGQHTIALNIFSDIYANVTVLIARSKEEAQAELEKEAAAKIAKSKEQVSDSEASIDSKDESTEAEYNEYQSESSEEER